MAGSFFLPSSSSSSWRIFYICFIAFILLNGSCFESRPVAVEKKGSSAVTVTVTPLELLKIYQENHKHRKGFMVFNVLPKGTPVPPSGPSKRHNSLGN
ncbi:hypothetical protein M9H77_09650 [Catharanthus roseus]|uniref:Uncharacterized protein n=1 Tax=Catharanthus roseus TaxID=4058 RepID=A0ACC0C1C2_CATRO|nr:hypothetical protein M9H77_09650 [Catharanthus roseus]